MKKKKAVKEVTIVGFVREIRDDDDEVSLEISADDDDYAVEMNKQGKKLLSLAGNDVEVTGIVTQDDDGISRISVSSFEVLESDDDDDEHLYDDEDEDDDRDYRHEDE